MAASAVKVEVDPRPVIPGADKTRNLNGSANNGAPADPLSVGLDERHLEAPVRIASPDRPGSCVDLEAAAVAGRFGVKFDATGDQPALFERASSRATQHVQLGSSQPHTTDNLSRDRRAR